MPSAQGAEEPVEQASLEGVVATAATRLPPFRKRKAMRHVRRMARDIGVRVRATRGETLAARYMRDKLRTLGYEVKMQKFSVDGRTSRNVVARWPGADPHGFVVGGHIDTVPGSPGANDNASGAAVVLEMARIFAGRRASKWVTFVGFGAEEYGADGTHHVGSQVYVKRLRAEGRARLAGMLSVDMVADGRPLLVGNSDIADDVVARTVYNKMREAKINVAYRVLCDCSDHGPFEHAGIPASFAWSGSEPNYHSPSDTVPNMEPKDLHRSGRAVRAFLKHVRKKMLDRFRANR